MNKVLLIVPTRGRPEKVQEFYDEFIKHSSITDLIFGIDEDDDSVYPELPGAKYEVNPRLRMCGTLNLIANKYANDYEYIAFLGDDHRIRTKDWDVILTNGIANKKYGITYGDDLLQGEQLPTAVLLKSNIVKALGYMAPPVLIHLYLDNFWKDLGNKLGTLVYNPNVIIEHMHYSIGKSTADDLYLEVNSNEIGWHDREKYFQYVQNGDMQKDLIKLV